MLERIAAHKKEEVKRDKLQLPLGKLIKQVVPGTMAFSKALTGKSWSLIAECKLASPVKGRLSERTVGELARIYDNEGAAALSVLTDSHFCGTDQHIGEVRQVSSLPVLRKDFIVDEYQLYQARLLGADAVLLIAAILTDAQVQQYLATARQIGLDCLVEVHSREELKRVQQTPAAVIGINNRNLTTFTTNVENTFELLPYCAADRLFISESGIHSRETAAALQRAGIRGVLVGEGLVTAQDIALKVRELSLQGGITNAK
ncbi:indole-3-glycerol phosphate synthase [Anaerospora hongkongensis]|uniref:indole-3-glycerol-phosphate synthase n=1 Tax=Anaerospora hongkongensis TaxID=244830 RepID=A0A4V2Q8Y3_9FIRM|nr:indole-3-glycerol phosphate synthase TrpC [Anaerospora hongkongensis]TCL39144.1 indole-3-glycerol phosphate synthase [Anaerospora hongkongensis]